ncbi:MAG: hypothetical protein AB7P69_05110 [Candidatus Binatia bacterium]
MINENSHRDCPDVKSELAALKLRIQELEAQMVSVKQEANPRRCPGFSKGLILGLAPFLGLILLIGNTLYGQGVGDAFFIDANGNVGVGTTDPATALEVKGQGGANVDLQVSGRIKSNSANGGLWLNDTDDAFVGSNPEDKTFGLWTKSVGWALQIQKASGNIGIGAPIPQDKLDVAGNVRLLSGKGQNPLRITSQWSGFPDTTTNQGEISNDTASYKTLMIVGNKSNDGKTRRVSVWDRLEVNGSLKANSLQIGNTTIDERGLVILNKLAAGQLVIDLYNTRQQEYAYAADFAPYDNDRRRVFTWRKKNQRVGQGRWQLRFPN